MRRVLALATLAAVLHGQDVRAAERSQAMAAHEGILQGVANAAVTPTEQGFAMRRLRAGSPIVLTFSRCDAVGVNRQADQWWIVPTGLSDGAVEANRAVWVLPAGGEAPAKRGSAAQAGPQEHAWRLELQGATATVARAAEANAAAGVDVRIDANEVVLFREDGRPHRDVLGNRFAVNVGGSAALEDALAGFYWGTMVPSVVERTMARTFRYSSGYVLSTLDVKSYAGSYPAVDHEFQIKGRLAVGSAADLDVVRRMIELQFQLMRDDPEHLYRSPTSVQPDGRREYHIRRNSKDARENAAMFPLTGNIEVLEESWRYFTASKNRAWLAAHVADLEHAADWVVANTDQYGRVWSDVYYEDQVIKDGREVEAQAFAARNFDLLARMEEALGRAAQAKRYGDLAKKMQAALIAQLPEGYWDAGHGRFVDWVDRNGVAHDHVALLANTLPATLGYATAAQAASVAGLLRANEAEFERFPSFVAADIAAYSSSEMGVAGPYDLSAAGRYWYWDAAYRAKEDESAMLLRQLQAVAAEGKKSGYLMGERYDMDHVYYVDGKNDHGAQRYYEYPNVFAAVLVEKLLGLSMPEDADVAVAPHLSREAEVAFEAPAYAVAYRYDAGGFALRNLAGTARRVTVDLSGLERISETDAGPGRGEAPLRFRRDGGKPEVRATLVLPARGEVRWSVVR